MINGQKEINLDNSTSETSKKGSISLGGILKGAFNEVVMFITAIFTAIVFIFTLGKKKTLDKTSNAVMASSDPVGATATMNTELPAAPMADTSPIAESAQKASYNPNAVTPIKKTMSQKITEFVKEKYENIPSVKEKKRKLEESLVPLVLDPTGADAVKYPTKQTFKYVARNKDGKVVTDYFAAFSKVDVYSFLQDEGFIVYEISTDKNINFMHGSSSAFATKMKTKDLIFWLSQLSTYIKAGIPLTDAVRVLAQQDTRKKYKTLYDAIIYELTMGETFSTALEKQGKSFPALLINMIKSSEMIGNIEQTLDEMSGYYQEIEDTKKAVISAIAYPAVVFVFAIGISIFMLTYIVPKFTEVFDSMGAELPKITVITLQISDFLKTKYMYLIGGVVGVVVSFLFLFKKVKAFREFMQTIFMKIPVVGKIIISKEINTFCRTFATLQKNNVLVADSIDVLIKITENEVYKDLLIRTVDNLIKGNKMSDTFKDNWAIPDIAYFMIVTGESTGELAEMLDKVADFYQKEQRNATSMIKTFIEPVMIIMLALIVGVLLISVLVPMFGMYGTVA